MSSYLKAFRRASKKMLDADQFAKVHLAARGSAGGTGANISRMSKDPDKADLISHKRFLEEQIAALAQDIEKMGPTSSQVHVNGMGGIAGVIPPKKQKAGVTKADHVVPTRGLDEDMVRHAVGEFFDDPSGIGPSLDAQRLIAGMDHEMANGAIDPTEARARASRNLATSMGHYTNAQQQSPQLRRLVGMDLDLASGSNRAQAHLGLDIYPFDYGTAIHDLALGIPFPDGSVRAVRLTNALQQLPEYADNPLPLLMEIQRVLTPGGEFYYEGTLDLTQVPGFAANCPGLVLSDYGDMTQLDATQDAVPSQMLQQTFTRVQVKLPAVYGADPVWLGTLEEQPLDLALALSALGGNQPAELTMANLINKSGKTQQTVEVLQKTPVMKASAWQQIVYGVVLTPDEVDSQDDVMDARDIEKTAHQFLIDSRIVGSEHEKPAEDSVVVESYISPNDQQWDGGEYGPQLVKKGSWVLAVKILSSDNWQKVLDGQYTGYSVGGFGTREER